MTEEEILCELAEFARDPHRDQLLEKFNSCPESRQLSELLGAALGIRRRGYSRQEESGALLPVPPGLVHPG